MPNKRILRAIFFDIDDTLYSSSEFAALARLNAIKSMIKAGLRMEIKEALSLVSRIMAQRHSNYKYLFNDLLRLAGAPRHSGTNPSILIAAGIVGYHSTKSTGLRPYPDVTEVLKILSQTTPLSLGVISSGLSIKQAEKLFRFGFQKYLNPDAIFFSESLGVDKPSPEFFQRPCSKIGVDLREAMYVGDRPVNDIAPPKSLGMITVLNRRSGKYMDSRARVKPDFVVHDFWELLECVSSHFDLKSPVKLKKNKKNGI